MHSQHRFLIVKTSSLEKEKLSSQGWKSPTFRNACLGATTHVWVPPSMLECRHPCLGSAMHAWMTLCRLRSAYPRLGASMHCQIRRHTPKCAKNVNHNLAQHGLKPVIKGILVNSFRATNRAGSSTHYFVQQHCDAFNDRSNQNLGSPDCQAR